MIDAVSTDILETFPNPRPDRPYLIEIRCPEFTSVCPKTGQPDFGVLTFRYEPGAVCVELKSLKLYLQAYRNRGLFYESAVNQILEDFIKVSQPRKAMLIGDFSARGGITTSVTVSYVAD